MTCSEFTNLVDVYLTGDIPEKKREMFEAHFFECDDCFTQLKLRERLYSKEIPIVVEGKKAAFSWIRYWKPALVLSSFLILLISSWLVVDNYNQAKFLKDISSAPAPVYIQSETRSAAQNEIFSNAMSFYNNKQYGSALEVLNSIGEEDNPQLRFFKGICSMETGAPRTAIKYFNVIIENMNPSYYDEAIFYKSIALLRLNKKKAALKHLNHLASMFSPYSKKAKEIIAKIKTN
jgi:tetratricopeptide (TPR) repeat protein